MYQSRLTEVLTVLITSALFSTEEQVSKTVAIAGVSLPGQTLAPQETKMNALIPSNLRFTVDPYHFKLVRLTCIVIPLSL